MTDHSLGWILWLTRDVLLCVIHCVSIFLHLVYRKIFGSKERRLYGDVALVTGAGQGLGRELAMRLCREGCIVVCVDVNASTNNVTVDTLKKIGGKVFGYACDVSDKASVVELANKVQQDVGKVDILVNNAGILGCQAVSGAHLHDKMAGLMNINTMSHFWTTQAFLPGMLQRDRGHIVAISSMAALVGLGSGVTYAASKAAIAAMMKSLGEELRSQGRKSIKLSCVHPYYIETPLIEEHCKIGSWAPMTVEFAAADIIKGIKKGQTSFVVPRSMNWMIRLMMMLPKEIEDKIKDVFFTTLKLEPYELVSAEQYSKAKLWK